MELLFNTVSTVVETIVDVAPIVAVLIFFQVAVIRQPVPNLRRTVTGIIYVVIGLSLFIVGLREALFPLGEIMARQLTAPDFIGGGGAPPPPAARARVAACGCACGVRRRAKRRDRRG